MRPRSSAKRVVSTPRVACGLHTWVFFWVAGLRGTSNCMKGQRGRSPNLVLLTKGALRKQASPKDPRPGAAEGTKGAIVPLALWSSLRFGPLCRALNGYMRLRCAQAQQLGLLFCRQFFSRCRIRTKLRASALSWVFSPNPLRRLWSSGSGRSGCTSINFPSP